MPQHIVVTDYNPAWRDKFEREAKLVRGILGNLCVAVYHIGSTAVPGLKAKPIIDIMPVVSDIAAVDSLQKKFEAAGYEYMGEFGIPGRRYLRKGGDERTHQVHIFAEADSCEIVRHLAVRDYLCSHPQEAAAYGTLKKKLALKYPYDIEGYCNGKDAFVKKLEQKALDWANKNNSAV